MTTRSAPGSHRLRRAFARLRSKSPDARFARRWIVLVTLVALCALVTAGIVVQVFTLIRQRGDLARRATAAGLAAAGQAIRQHAEYQLLTDIAPGLVRSVFGQEFDLAHPPTLRGFQARAERELATSCACVAPRGLSIRVDTGGAWVASPSAGLRVTILARLADTLEKQSGLPHVVTSQVFGHHPGEEAHADTGVIVAGILITPPPLAPRVLGYTAYAASARAPRLVYAIELEASLLFTHAISVAREGLDSTLEVTVRDASGRVVYATIGADSSGTATPALPADVGALVLLLKARPLTPTSRARGDRLIPLLGLLALGIGFMAVAMLQLRGEYELAGRRARFVSGVSHELRTPLAQIRLFAELLQDGGNPEGAERGAYARIIDEEAQRLTYLVDNLLTFATLESSLPRLGPVSLSIVARETVERFRPLAAADDAAIALAVTPGIRVRGSHDILRRILLNLLDNAAKYGPRGQTIWVALTTDRQVAQLTVQDQGPGVPAADRLRVFDPYVRLDEAAERVGGTGIGLAVVRDLVTQLGGEVWIDDPEPGGGTRVIVTFPALEPEAVADEPAAEKGAAGP